jgi:sRNA-binding carbon storage regulator CsrA
MLVLQLCRDQRVIIHADDGRVLGMVTLAAVHGDKVRIGFDFPPTASIVREEIAPEVVAANVSVALNAWRRAYRRREPLEGGGRGESAGR